MIARSRLLAVASALVLAAPAARADYIDHFANPHDIGILKIPRTGSPRILVIPVIIDDLPFETASEAQWLDEVRAFYDPDASGWALRPYLQTASLGRYSPIPEVAEPVRFASCPPIGGEEDCEIPRGAGFATGNLQQAFLILRDALVFVDQILACASDGPGDGRTCTDGGGVDFARYDSAGPNGDDTPDGVVDGVILVSNAGFPGIALPIRDLSEADLLAFLGPLPQFSYDDIVVGAVAIAGREEAPRRATFVSVHELGHLLGWADLYTETGINTDMPYTLMGGWFYAEAGSLPDAYSRAAANWAHVIQHSGTQSYTLAPASVGGPVVKVGTGDEFFMVELRERRDDVDADLAIDGGVVVERVRLQRRPSPERSSYPATLANYVNDNPDDAFLIIEQADGLFDLERGRARRDGDDLFLAGDSIVPSDDTGPRTAQHRVFSTNLFDGTPTGITIRVTDVTRGSATVEIEAPDVDDRCAAIADLCGELPCVDGACGSPSPPPAVLEPPGCGCGAVDPSLAGLGVALVALLRRPRARRARSRPVND